MKYFLILVVIIGAALAGYFLISKKNNQGSIPNDRAGILKALLMEGGLEEGKDRLNNYTDQQLKDLLIKIRNNGFNFNRSGL